jgi:hypothetical protein
MSTPPINPAAKMINTNQPSAPRPPEVSDAAVPAREDAAAVGSAGRVDVLVAAGVRAVVCVGVVVRAVVVVGG